jgi:hypothetical protein
VVRCQSKFRLRGVTIVCALPEAARRPVSAGRWAGAAGSSPASTPPSSARQGRAGSSPASTPPSSAHCGPPPGDRALGGGARGARLLQQHHFLHSAGRHLATGLGRALGWGARELTCFDNTVVCILQVAAQQQASESAGRCTLLPPPPPTLPVPFPFLPSSLLPPIQPTHSLPPAHNTNPLFRTHPQPCRDVLLLPLT